MRRGTCKLYIHNNKVAKCTYLIENRSIRVPGCFYGKVKLSAKPFQDLDEKLVLKERLTARKGHTASEGIKNRRIGKKLFAKLIGIIFSPCNLNKIHRTDMKTSAEWLAILMGAFFSA